MKKLSILYILLSTVFLFTACQNSVPDNTDEEPGNPEAVYTATDGTDVTLTATFYDNNIYTYKRTQYDQTNIEAKGTYEKTSGNFINGTITVTQTHKKNGNELVSLTSSTSRTINISNSSFTFDFLNHGTTAAKNYTKQ